MSEQQNEETGKVDKVKISEEVIETIVGIAASQVENTSTLTTGFAEGIAGVLGRKSTKKGVKVEVDGEEVNVELSVTVDYGFPIHVLARNIQDKVRQTVEEMTGMKVVSVAVNVFGVNIDEESNRISRKKSEREEILLKNGNENNYEYEDENENEDAYE